MAQVNGARSASLAFKSVHETFLVKAFYVLARILYYCLMLVSLAAGCGRVMNAPMPPMTPPVVAFGPPVPAYNPPQLVPTVVQSAVSNPILVPVTDRDVAWDNIVDVIDDYFKIQREDRVHQIGDILSEGQIETFPQTGATFLEPWRGDSANFYERLESTFQSIRRKAVVRVIPDASGFLVDVTVLKELEDVERPMYATAAQQLFEPTIRSTGIPKLNRRWHAKLAINPDQSPFRDKQPDGSAWAAILLWSRNCWCGSTIA